MKCAINVMCLNHPQTISHLQPMEELSFTKPEPGAKKVRDHWSIGPEIALVIKFSDWVINTASRFMDDLHAWEHRTQAIGDML